MQGFLSEHGTLFSQGGAGSYEPQVGVSTPCREASTRRGTVLVPDLLTMPMYGMIHDAKIISYPSRVVLALRNPS